MLFGELQRQGVKAAHAFYRQQQSLVTLQARRCQEVCYLVLDGIDIFYDQAEFSLLSLGRQPEFGLLRIEPQLQLVRLQPRTVRQFLPAFRPLRRAVLFPQFQIDAANIAFGEAGQTIDAGPALQGKS